MKFSAAQIIQAELGRDESILWTGQPQQGLVFRGSDLFAIPFSLLWGGFAFYWEYLVLTSKAPFFFILFGVPFVLIGIYMTVGRFFVEVKQREKTFYGVSNQRIIIISGLFKKTVKSLDLKTLTDITLSESSLEKGTISFGNAFPFASMFGGLSWPGMDQFIGPRFELIKNAKQVYEHIRKAQQDAN